MRCICKSSDLFNFGCRCGAFQFEQELHIWFNGLDYVIARTEREADACLSQFLSKSITSCWELFPRDSELVIAIAGEEVTKKAAGWIDLYGEGFLASLDDLLMDIS